MSLIATFMFEAAKLQINWAKANGKTIDPNIPAVFFEFFSIFTHLSVKGPYKIE